VSLRDEDADNGLLVATVAEIHRTQLVMSDQLFITQLLNVTIYSTEYTMAGEHYPTTLWRFCYRSTLFYMALACCVKVV